jgi:alcohol dehydrogenase (cytochrome c)
MIVNARFAGRNRQLLVQANRNGFFYVLDRTDGRLLQATPFVKRLNWASGVDTDGRPKVLPDSAPTAQGTTTCPSIDGATNWMSTACDADRGVFFVMAMEKCSVFVKADAVWKAGQEYYGGDARDVRGDPGQKFVRALDIATGKILWEYPQIGPSTSWGGVLATAGGLVFVADDSGAFSALEAATGKPLWHHQTNALWKASPMTYAVAGKQFVAIASGPNILAFGLP